MIRRQWKCSCGEWIDIESRSHVHVKPIWPKPPISYEPETRATDAVISTYRDVHVRQGHEQVREVEE